MLSQTGVIFYSIAVLFLLPLALWSLARGSQPPSVGPLAKFYAVEKYLNRIGDLFLVVVCANAALQLAAHFELISLTTLTRIEPLVTVPFFVLLLAFLGLWIRAALKLRRAPQP